MEGGVKGAPLASIDTSLVTEGTTDIKPNHQSA